MKKVRKERAPLDASKPQTWLKARQVPTELKTQLSNMTKKEQRIAFANKSLSFGTAGVRAKMGPGPHYMNKFTYQQMMIGYCKYVQSVSHRRPAIVIGHDNRNNSAEFALECANVAKAMGVDVYLMQDNKLIPTPILSYAIRKYHLQGGVNITASHNPKEDNGFKAYNKLGAQILPDEANIIIKNMPSSKVILDLKRYLKSKSKAKANISYIKYDSLVDNFFDEVIKATVIDRRVLMPNAPIKKFPIVFTGFHGTTSELMPRFLKSIGFKNVYVYPKHEKISGNFEDCPISNPEDEHSFDDVVKFANEKKSTIVIACDPDGDRMAMGFKKTNRWRILNGNEMGIIFSHYILTRKKFGDKTPLIISTHVSTNYIDRIAEKYNCEILRTKTGFKWMANTIDNLPKKYQFVLGFEEAIGALVHNVCRDKDSFGAVLLALEIFNKGNAYFPDLHDYLYDRIYDIYGPTFSHTYSYTIKSANWEKDANKMMFRARHWKDKKIFDYEIQKIWYEKESDCVVWTLNNDSWIKFRISGTEPKFKVYICFNNEMSGQLKAAAVMNISKIERQILKGFDYKK